LHGIGAQIADEVGRGGSPGLTGGGGGPPAGKTVEGDRLEALSDLEERPQSLREQVVEYSVAVTQTPH